MKQTKFFKQAVLTFWVFAVAVFQSATAEYPIAGVNPDQRPAGAPVIEWVEHDKAWYQHALTGIDRPYPPSLYFLDNQGDWYTPFNHPGMGDRYDIRGWHRDQGGN